VGKRFGAVVAAADIDVRILQGEHVSLIGSNGAGKTTLMRTLAGLLMPSAGTIRLAGGEITRQGVARSFQIPQLYGELSVLENMLVAQACQTQRFSLWQPARSPEAVALAEGLLARFRLAEHRDRRVAELPGGVRKLLDIAMALTGTPKLLLLDEPTSGVSAEEKLPMMDTIMGALGDLPLTVLFVEHDMDIVRRHAGRVIAFASGRIIADGPPDVALATDEVRRHVTGELVAE